MCFSAASIRLSSEPFISSWPVPTDEVLSMILTSAEVTGSAVSW